MKASFKLCCLALIILVSGSTALFGSPEVTSTDKNSLIKRTILWQGIERNYLIHLPPVDYMLASMPVIVNLHGGGGTAKGTSRLNKWRFNELADQDGFIVVYPNAIDKSWNDGRSQILKPQNKDVDDVGFIAAIIQELKAIYDVDLTKIYATGMSNGGFMTTRLLCDRADLFRGGAVVTASISKEYFPQCAPTQKVGVLVINGTADPLVPYNGGQIKVFRKTRGEILSTDDYINFWIANNDCNSDPSRTDLPDSKPYDGTTVTVSQYDCDTGNPVVLYRVNGGGHTWPGGKQYLGKRLIGVTSREFNACEVIWDFFKTLE
ncbi:MAG: PHB depolymerase family esterase [Gilvibacter sp.]